MKIKNMMWTQAANKPGKEGFYLECSIEVEDENSVSELERAFNSERFSEFTLKPDRYNQKFSFIVSGDPKNINDVFLSVFYLQQWQKFSGQDDDDRKIHSYTTANKEFGEWRKSEAGKTTLSSKASSVILNALNDLTHSKLAGTEKISIAATVAAVASTPTPTASKPATAAVQTLQWHEMKHTIENIKTATIEGVEKRYNESVEWKKAQQTRPLTPDQMAVYLASKQEIFAELKITPDQFPIPYDEVIINGNTALVAKDIATMEVINKIFNKNAQNFTPVKTNGEEKHVPVASITSKSSAPTVKAPEWDKVEGGWQTKEVLTKEQLAIYKAIKGDVLHRGATVEELGTGENIKLRISGNLDKGVFSDEFNKKAVRFVMPAPSAPVKTATAAATTKTSISTPVTASTSSNGSTSGLMKVSLSTPATAPTSVSSPASTSPAETKSGELVFSLNSDGTMFQFRSNKLSDAYISKYQEIQKGFGAKGITAKLDDNVLLVRNKEDCKAITTMFSNKTPAPSVSIRSMASPPRQRPEPEVVALGSWQSMTKPRGSFSVQSGSINEATKTAIVKLRNSVEYPEFIISKVVEKGAFVDVVLVKNMDVAGSLTELITTSNKKSPQQAELKAVEATHRASVALNNPAVNPKSPLKQPPPQQQPPQNALPFSLNPPQAKPAAQPPNPSTIKAAWDVIRDNVITHDDKAEILEKYIKGLSKLKAAMSTSSEGSGFSDFLQNFASCAYSLPQKKQEDSNLAAKFEATQRQFSDAIASNEFLRGAVTNTRVIFTDKSQKYVQNYIDELLKPIPVAQHQPAVLKL